jgi:molybdenum cofactor guanylyltransferase
MPPLIEETVMDRSAIVLATDFLGNFEAEDKFVLELGGKPLIRRVMDAVEDLVDETIVVTSSQKQADCYSKVVGSDAKFVVEESDKGPLVSALAGLQASTNKNSAILAADLPFVAQDVIELLFDLCHGKTAALPRFPNGQVEHLHAVYHTKSALEASRLATAEDRFDFPSMIDHMGGVRYISTLVIQELDPDLRTLFAINTPLDLKRAQVMLGVKPKKKSR